ncbi:MAG: hypothetical protein NZ455_00180 [Bacteroidia bacterium]|nr:hypothetical protein [Bacteroidia bacterium]
MNVFVIQFYFWACPCLRFAALMQARSACYGLRYRFGATHC